MQWLALAILAAIAIGAALRLRAIQDDAGTTPRQKKITIGVFVASLISALLLGSCVIDQMAGKTHLYRRTLNPIIY